MFQKYLLKKNAPPEMVLTIVSSLILNLSFEWLSMYFLFSVSRPNWKSTVCRLLPRAIKPLIWQPLMSQPLMRQPLMWQPLMWQPPRSTKQNKIGKFSENDTQRRLKLHQVLLIKAQRTVHTLMFWLLQVLAPEYLQSCFLHETHKQNIFSIAIFVQIIAFWGNSDF